MCTLYITLISQKMEQLIAGPCFFVVNKNDDILILPFHFFVHSVILSLSGYSKVNLNGAKPVYKGQFLT